jgi:hypothetical protein
METKIRVHTMDDLEKANYDEWKKKCADTRARKKREALAATARGEAKALADALDVGPGYRRIKSGPNKGAVVWKGSSQQRLDEAAIAKENRRKKEEERRAQRLLDREETGALLQSIEERKASKRREIVSPEIVWAFIFIYSVSIISFLIAKMFASFGIMGLAIFIDAVCYMLYAKRSRYSRYLPFLWWILHPKK